jgi:hypothetical protein
MIASSTRLKLTLFWDRVRWPFVFFFAVGILAAALFAVYPIARVELPSLGKPLVGSQRGSGAPNEISQAMREGKYDIALEKLQAELAVNPSDADLRLLHSQLMDELRIDFKFNYLPGRRGQVMTQQTSPGVFLTEKDPYYLIVQSAEPCYLYLFQLQSSGELTELFPNKKYVPTVNPVPGGPIRIPDGYGWFYLDDVPGTETIYLLASRWQQSEIESLSARLEVGKDSEEKAMTTRDILSRLQREEGAADKLPGLAFAKHQFRHELSLK